MSRPLLIHFPNFLTVLRLTIVGLLLCSSLTEAALFGKKANVYSMARDSCVELLIRDRHAGSGWIATKDGKVITAAHVVGTARSLQVLLPRNLERSTATVIALDKGHDLALLQITDPPAGIKRLRLASSIPKPGDNLSVYGAPIFRHGVLLQGQMARATPSYEYYGNLNAYVGCYHVSGMAPRGVSGAPWMNHKGQVIGVQSGGMSVGTTLYGISFISPLDAVRQLLKTERNRLTATLGVAIEETWQQDRAYLDALPEYTDGLVIKVLIKNGAAAKAGLKQMEIIKAIDDKPVRLPDELLNLIRSKKPGDKVDVDVVDRTGKNPRTISVTLRPL